MTGEKYVQTSLSLQDSSTDLQVNNIPGRCRGWQGANRKVKWERVVRAGGGAGRPCGERAGQGAGPGRSGVGRVDIQPVFNSDFLGQDFLVKEQP